MEIKFVVIDEVEDFIKRFTARELVLLPQAQTMLVTFSEGEKDLSGRLKNKKGYLNDLLGHAIAEYQRCKDFALPNRYDSAFAVFELIQRAHAYGVIRDVKQQTIAYEQEIERLKKQLDDCMTLNQKMALENKRLHNLVPNFDSRKGKTEVGNVGGIPKP